MKKHLILIGFKHSGKSTLGRELGAKLGRNFVDLDEAIQAAHLEQTGEDLSCREILRGHGEEHFRELEHEVLKTALTNPNPLILALGGGTPMMQENQDLIRPHQVVHISAPKSVIFERIMIHGKPAFFSAEVDAFDHFQELWAKRAPIFESLADVTIQNKGALEPVVNEIIEHFQA
jgi:shikimate kinase